MSYSYDRQAAMDSNAPPKKLLEGIEAAQSALHAALRTASSPQDATTDEKKKFGKIVREAKAMLDKTEDLRLDLDEWIIDYDEAHKG